MERENSRGIWLNWQLIRVYGKDKWEERENNRFPGQTEE